MANELDTVEIARESSQVVKQADAMIVADVGGYEQASVFLRMVKTVADKIEELYGPRIASAYALHKGLLSDKKKFTDPLDRASGNVKGKMQAWSMEEERKRRQEEARIREQLRREEEDRRLAEAAELERLAQAEAASGNQAVAVEMMKSAETLITEPIYAPPIVLPAAVPKVEGVSTRTDWKFRVVDASKVPDEYKLVDEVKIGKVVRALRESTNIPGIEAYPVQVTSTRAY